MNLRIYESDDPVLIGNKDIGVDSDHYFFEARTLRPLKVGGIEGEERRKFVLEGQMAHLLVVDLLRKEGWEIAPHILGRGASPLLKCDPVKFIEDVQSKQLHRETRSFLSKQAQYRKRNIGIPGVGLNMDLLIANTECCALLEIKSTTLGSCRFNLNTLGQFLFYLEASKLGIPVKFLFLKFKDDWELILTRFPDGHFIKNGAICPRVNFKPKWDGTMFSLLILRYLALKPHLSFARLLSELHEFRTEGGRIEVYLGELLDNAWIERDNECFRITDNGIRELTRIISLLATGKEFVSERLMRLLTALQI